ncbi:MAG: hypothetical protein MZU95_01565 [Desulfomicrobium escambiense]|nr:hypothetical protein [Desulfomicrobium escambiense]
MTGGVDDYRYEDVASGVPDPSLRRGPRPARDPGRIRGLLPGLLPQLLLRDRRCGRATSSSPRSRPGATPRRSRPRAASAFPLVGRARGTVRFGWKSFRPDDPLQTGLLGPRRGERTSISDWGGSPSNLGLDRDIAFSYLESAYYYVDTRARTGLSLYLFRSSAGRRRRRATGRWPTPSRRRSGTTGSRSSSRTARTSSGTLRSVPSSGSAGRPASA